MKLLVLLIIIWGGSNDPASIAKTNKLKKEAAEAFLKNNFEKAAANYSMLYDSMNINEPAIGLNLGHSYFQLGDSSNAKLAYQSVATSTDKKLKSIAYQQLGIMSQNPQNLKQSLDFFKEAIKADPTNAQARYNYEVVKKKMQNQQQNQDKNEDDKNEDIEPSEYAKELKKRADQLRQMGLFAEAYNLMMEGLKKDETVKAYNQYIGKLKNVAEI